MVGRTPRHHLFGGARPPVWPNIVNSAAGFVGLLTRLVRIAAEPLVCCCHATGTLGHLIWWGEAPEWPNIVNSAAVFIWLLIGLVRTAAEPLVCWCHTMGTARRCLGRHIRRDRSNCSSLLPRLGRSGASPHQRMLVQRRNLATDYLSGLDSLPQQIQGRLRHHLLKRRPVRWKEQAFHLRRCVCRCQPYEYRADWLLRCSAVWSGNTGC